MENPCTHPDTGKSLISYPMITAGLSVCAYSDKLFGQLLRGQFQMFLPLLRTIQQLSVVRCICTIPHQRFLYKNGKSGQQDLNLRPHGPQPCALPNYAMLRFHYSIVADMSKNFNLFLIFFKRNYFCFCV